GDTTTCSAAAYAFNPYISEANPYAGAYLAVVESVAKLAAAGIDYRKSYLTFQEYFEKMRDETSFGKPVASLLGALKAQIGLGIASIGGKDSMSGSYEDIHVPPTLVSFAVGTGKTGEVITPEFKSADSKVYYLPPVVVDGLVDCAAEKALMSSLYKLIVDGKVVSAYATGTYGIAEAILKMGLGNRIGFRFADGIETDIFAPATGGFVVESEIELSDAVLLGETTSDYTLTMGDESVGMDSLEETYDSVLESVYPKKAEAKGEAEKISFNALKRVTPLVRVTRPHVVIPVFPGTNCEYDTAKAFEAAGADAEIVVLNNKTAAKISESVENFVKVVNNSQIIFVPGGFSAGDEPEGSGKFITAFFRNPAIADSVCELLDKRDGLIGGICNGFQALIKLGLLPYGKITETTENSPTLTYNVIGRHQSGLVRTRIASNKSPWLMYTEVGDIHLCPVSHGEGRFIAPREVMEELIAKGQIATQYVDYDGNPSMDIRFNPNGSVCAVEGITSPDGRVFGKMGHSERTGRYLYKNVEGNTDNGMFKGAVDYFRL
ncbi:MAG: phosphoribosylformylglycinamidine synthase subunit PurQ, partial [Christensenellales bacterium]